MKSINVIYALLIIVLAGSACKKDNPVDEDGLLITSRAECAVTNFELLGTDFVTVRTKAAAIDTTAQTIAVTVMFGTDLKNLYPQFTLSQDCKLDPKITGRTDFSDLANPRVYTVVSGNRQVRKPYKVLITVQPR
ncbi:hypothetical protein D3H65_05315 [Paraflavitalea soli]|uniref:DUF4625 domain-containing protein n=1 Tax=Paraflavitalea soli TaxID=2315862 RepID=A0A3B7MJX9_9BACT|nr:hypothetical protein [Paraflavitalea soli]AXY73430.1 hypothetical protein D3H65_05315 [Paraflavitalea soli]